MKKYKIKFLVKNGLEDNYDWFVWNKNNPIMRYAKTVDLLRYSDDFIFCDSDLHSIGIAAQEYANSKGWTK